MGGKGGVRERGLGRVNAELLTACSMLNRTLGNAFQLRRLISLAHQSPSIPHIRIDRTSLLCGPTRNKALVLALLNGSKLKHIISPSLILTNIQFGPSSHH